jgi:hypothetical protein
VVTRLGEGRAGAAAAGVWGRTRRGHERRGVAVDEGGGGCGRPAVSGLGAGGTVSRGGAERARACVRGVTKAHGKYAYLSGAFINSARQTTVYSNSFTFS